MPSCYPRCSSTTVYISSYSHWTLVWTLSEQLSSTLCASSKFWLEQFCHPILLRTSCDSVLVLNATFGSESSHSIAHVATLVIPKSLQLTFPQVLCKYLEAFKGLKNIWLGSSWHHKTIPGVVIVKCNPVAIAREGFTRHHVYISVHELQRMRSMPLRAREWIVVHLASQAWLTDWIRWSPDVQLYPSNPITLVQQVQTRVQCELLKI